MKPSLQMNLTNQLTLTHKRQQAIHLLLLATVNLQQEIQQQLKSNPLLEVKNPNQYLASNLQEALCFLNSIQSCQETLLKAARFIVDYQKELLEFGENAVKPLANKNPQSSLSNNRLTQLRSQPEIKIAHRTESKISRGNKNIPIV